MKRNTKKRRFNTSRGEGPPSERRKTRHDTSSGGIESMNVTESIKEWTEGIPMRENEDSGCEEMQPEGMTDDAVSGYQGLALGGENMRFNPEKDILQTELELIENASDEEREYTTADTGVPSTSEPSTKTGKSGSSGVDHPCPVDDVGPPQDGSFVRIQRDRRTRSYARWYVLIPRKPKHRILNIEKSLVMIGIRFPSPEEAARAADVALIAMWGKDDAMEHLNYPVTEYDVEGYHQRFGLNLTRYLIRLMEQGEVRSQEAAPPQRPRYHEVAKLLCEIIACRRQLTREYIKEHPESKVGMEPCGVCPSCRQPWLSKMCFRVEAARREKYNVKDAVGIIVTGEEICALEVAYAAIKSKNKELAYQIRERLREGLRMLEQKVKETCPPPSSTAANIENIETDEQEMVEDIKEEDGDGTRKRESNNTDVKVMVGSKPEEFNWITKPRISEKERLKMRKRLLVNQVKANAELRAQQQGVLSGIAARLIESIGQEDYVESAVRLKFPTISPLHDIFWESRQAASKGQQILPIRQDDPIWMRPTSYIVPQCAHCRRMHKMQLKHCGIYQEACAERKKPYVLCDICNDQDSKCQYCTQGKIPDCVWKPKYLPCPWVDKLRGSTATFMLHSQRLASAVITEFDCLHLSECFTPNALLAFGMLAEAMAEESFLPNKGNEYD